MSSKKVERIISNISNNIPRIETKTMIVFILIVILIIIAYMFNIGNINSYKEGFIFYPNESGDCNKIDKAYREKKVSVKTVFGDSTLFLLRDYYIKSAYNACATDRFDNGYVDICALKHCIKQGARFLDFEIYSIDGEPVVACSPNRENEPTIKGSYNHIPFDYVMEVINSYAFTSKHTPVPEDPLLLHFRIKIIDDTYGAVYDKMSSIILKKLGTKLLNKNYSNEYNGKNLGKLEIEKLKGNAVIIIDASNDMFRNTRITDVVNTSSNSLHMRLYRYDSMTNLDVDDDLVSYNKNNMTICIPKSGSDPVNPDFGVASKLGTQVIAMCYQQFDTNMGSYHDYFNENKRSFILKPTSLRAPPIIEPEIEKQDPSYSYSNREVGIGIPGDEIVTLI
jgi:hypothetical protein